MKWITTATRKGFQGSLLPLGAYRRSTVPSADVAKVTEPSSTKDKVIASAIWEDVSSWAESEQTCSASESCTSVNSVISLEENISCSDDIQIRMERLRRLNPFHHSFSKSHETNRSVASMGDKLTGHRTEKSIPHAKGSNTAVMPVECALTDLIAWSRTVDNNGEDVLYLDTNTAETKGKLTATITITETKAKAEPAVTDAREHMPTGKTSLSCLRSWRVERLAPAEWSHLLELVDEEVIEM
ncbi:hypothetical protein LSM04_006150 [Trypanosoma melophagium]|uniref:uncharacterized protein n=1 Tax=Trypanosoma melophagium TaxID=715481 RepID=UPI00351AAA91|nr:hypothetical protein LSM04_006150 [Trypanosoma melophagium]